MGKCHAFYSLEMFYGFLSAVIGLMDWGFSHEILIIIWNIAFTLDKERITKIRFYEN